MSNTLVGTPFQEEFFRRHPGLRWLTDLFEYAPGMFFYAKDAENRFVRVNRANQAIYGVDAEEPLLGKTDRDFHPPVLAEAYIAEDQCVMRQRCVRPNQCWLVPYINGASQWFVSSKTPLLDEHDQVVGVAGVMYPIETPREQETRFGQLAPAVHFAEQNFREQISIAEMAERCSLSSSHFNRLFRSLLKMSPSEYLLSLRVQEARRMLADPSKSLANISVSAGFFDQSHFSKRFKKATGLTPTEYRKSIG